MKINISNKNSKMGAAVSSFSFPPVITCRTGAPCIRDCYACRMARIHPSVGRTWAENLDAWRESPEAVKAAIFSAAVQAKYFRYFVGGDIPDAQFFAVMVEIAEKIPDTNFLSFTKKFEIVNNFIDNGGIIPKNLKIIFSLWNGYTVENPHGLPVSAVVERGAEIPGDGVICGGSCADCNARGCGCWKLQNGEKVYFMKH